MVTTMISCEQHDYIEIACTFRYPLKLTLVSGAVIEGIGIDTARNAQKQECIEIDSGGEHTLVVLDEVSIIEACVDNPHFQTVSFERT